MYENMLQSVDMVQSNSRFKFVRIENRISLKIFLCLIKRDIRTILFVTKDRQSSVSIFFVTPYFFLAKN